MCRKLCNSKAQNKSKSNSEKEAESHDNQAFDKPIETLVKFCVLLVAIVVLWVFVDMGINLHYRSLIIQRLNDIQYITAEVLNPSDSSLILSGKDVKELLDSAMVETSTIMDSNNYLAIILTLITLCVSLSVVIPYIVGRSISAKTIKDTVDELYKKDRDNTEQKYKKYVEKLLLAEGHLSRMISYILLLSSKDKFNTVLTKEKYDEKAHPYWALGWGAKSVIRYIDCYSKSKNGYNASFINDAVKYVVDASNSMISQGISIETGQKAKEKIIRAFVDVVDLIGIDERHSGVLSVEQTSKIKESAKILYREIARLNITKEELIKVAVLKSKYKDYLSSKDIVPTQEEYIVYLKDKIADYELN